MFGAKVGIILDRGNTLKKARLKFNVDFLSIQNKKRIFAKYRKRKYTRKA